MPFEPRPNLGSRDFFMTSSGYANTRFSSILASRMTRLPCQASHKRLLGYLQLESDPTVLSEGIRERERERDRNTDERPQLLAALIHLFYSSKLAKAVSKNSVMDRCVGL
jgi:hypothetical protein